MRLDLRIGTRLGLGFGLILALVGAQVGLGALADARLAERERRVESLEPKVESAHRLEEAVFRQAIALRALVFHQDEPHRREFEARLADVRSELATLAAAVTEAREVHLIEDLGPEHRRFEAASRRLVELAATGEDTPGILATELELIGLRERLIESSAQLVRLSDAERDRLLAEARLARDREANVSFGLGLAVFAVGLLTAVWVTRRVRGSAEVLADAARGLAAGDWGPALALHHPDAPAHADELDQAAGAFGRMAAALRERERRLAVDAELGEALSATLDVERLGSEALRILAAHAGCESGVLYLREPASDRLVRLAGFAADAAAATLAAGEGLPGEAAAGTRPVVLRDLPADGPYRLRLGLSDVPARTVLALPVRSGSRSLGALVLASARDLPADAIDLAADGARQLAISLENAVGAREVARLAEALRENNERLAAQNEELQAQSEEIQAQNEELQAQAEEIVAQNEELHRQQQELVAADAMKDEFLSVASHELKSPIAALKSFCQLLVRRVRGRPELAELLPMLERVDAQADKVVGRVNRLLDVSRAKMGMLTATLERVELVPLVRGLIAQAQARTDRHRLVLDLEVDHVVGRWDRLYLEQAIGNLLDNAIRYSPDGGEVRVELGLVDGEARVAVSDRGIGLPPETAGRLFEPYFRGEAARRVAADGMGIGLFVTREIVALHGGRIWAEDHEGEGATFRLALPLAPAAASGAAA